MVRSPRSVGMPRSQSSAGIRPTVRNMPIPHSDGEGFACI
jgi:hypothetical protein